MGIGWCRIVQVKHLEVMGVHVVVIKEADYVIFIPEHVKDRFTRGTDGGGGSGTRRRYGNVIAGVDKFT